MMKEEIIKQTIIIVVVHIVTKVTAIIAKKLSFLERFQNEVTNCQCTLGLRSGKLFLNYSIPVCSVGGGAHCSKVVVQINLLYL